MFKKGETMFKEWKAIFKKPLFIILHQNAYDGNEKDGIRKRNIVHLLDLMRII